MVEAFFEGETPKWKLAYLLSSSRDGFWAVKTVTGDRPPFRIKEADIRIPSFGEDYSRGFTYGLTKREYITAECDEWHRGYIMGVVARVGG